MGTVVEKFQYIEGTKQAIKKAIKNKGVDVSDTDTFRSYAEKIESIGGGGGGSDTFEAQLLLANVVNSGVLETEEEVVNETVAVLRNVTGE